MRLYIAARSIEQATILRDELISNGHDITARWIVMDTKFASEIDSYTDDERRELSIMDEQDVRAADDGLVLIAELQGVMVPGGKHVETGMALALERPVYVIGRRENVFHWHPRVMIFADNATLRRHLKSLAT